MNADIIFHFYNTQHVKTIQGHKRKKQKHNKMGQTVFNPNLKQLFKVGYGIGQDQTKPTVQSRAVHNTIIQ